MELIVSCGHCWGETFPPYAINCTRFTNVFKNWHQWVKKTMSQEWTLSFNVLGDKNFNKLSFYLMIQENCKLTYFKKEKYFSEEVIF